jgi:amino acid transporter
VRLQRAGYTPFSRRVTVTTAGARVDASLPWADPIPPAEGARISLRCNVSLASVALDGHPVRADGGQVVPPGVHTLRVEQSDLKRNGSFFSGWLIVLCNLMIVAALLIIASPTITWFDAWHSLEKAVVWTFGSAFQVVATVVVNVWGAFADVFAAMRDWKVQ